MKTILVPTLRSLSLAVALAATAVLVRPADAQPVPGGAPAVGGAGAQAARGRAPAAAIPPGPPAPVPPEVAIQRPTADELAQINADLQRLATTDQSPGGTLLRKYQSLLTIPVPRANVAATFTQTQQRQGPRHLGFVDIAKKGDIDLLLEGDSITDWWIQNGKEAYDQYFGAIKTADFAISGDTTQGNLWGLKNGEGQGYQPKAVMLMIGTNNTGTNTAPEIAEGIGAVVLELRTDFPNAKILLLAVFPRNHPTDAVRPKIAEINQLISKLDDQKHVFYMDIGAKFLDPATGEFLPGVFMADNLHPTLEGYKIWGAAVKDTLATLMK